MTRLYFFEDGGLGRELLPPQSEMVGITALGEQRVKEQNARADVQGVGRGESGRTFDIVLVDHMLRIEEEWYGDHQIRIQILRLLVQVGALGQVGFDIGLVEQGDQLFGLVVDRRAGHAARGRESDIGAFTAVIYERVQVVGGSPGNQRTSPGHRPGRTYRRSVRAHRCSTPGPAG